MSIRAFYDQWPQYNQRLIDAIAGLTDEQLALTPATRGQLPDHMWPIWGTVGHTAGVRVYWLCGVAGEDGAETTPFTDPTSDLGWEDDPDHPRSAPDLVGALESTWAIVERVLDAWTPEMLVQPLVREYAGRRSGHKRGEIIQRMFSHDAYHAGELSQLLGVNGLPQVNLWDEG
jgi:uncharacterized damage-inducible protein DinB